MRSQELREQRAKIVANARVIIDGADGRELTPEEQAQVDAMFAEADAVEVEVEAASRKEKMEALEADVRAYGQSQGRKTGPNATRSDGIYGERDRKAALRSWALYGTEHADASGHVRNAAEHYGINLGSRTLNISSMSKRALVKGTASAGGALVPTDLQAEIIKRSEALSVMRQLARVITTDGGNPMEWPTVDDTAAATIVGELQVIPTGPDPVFSKNAIGAYKYASGIVRVSIELLQDAAVDIETLLADLFADRMTRGQEPHFVRGNGTTQPQGVATAASVAGNLASGNALTFDRLFDLVFSVDANSRKNAKFLVNDTTVAALRKLKDGQGRYLYEPSAAVGQEDTLLGYPLRVSSEMQDYTAPGDNQPLVMFGDFSNYIIRDVGPSFSIKRLDELYAATGEVGFVMLQRTDARFVGKASSLKVLNSFDAP